MDKVGAKISLLRHLRGFTLDDLAQRVEHTTDELRAIETGERALTHQDLVSIAEALEVDVDEFFVDDTEEPRPAEGDSVLIPATDLAALLDKMKQG